MKRLFIMAFMLSLLVFPCGVFAACSSEDADNPEQQESGSSSVEWVQEELAEANDHSVAEEPERAAVDANEPENVEQDPVLEEERAEAEAAVRAEAEAAARAEEEAAAQAQAKEEAEAAAQAQAEAEAAKMNQTVYMTETGKCFHLGGCSTLKSKIPITLREAIDVYHLQPCGKCHSGWLLN